MKYDELVSRVREVYQQALANAQERYNRDGPLDQQTADALEFDLAVADSPTAEWADWHTSIGSDPQNKLNAVCRHIGCDPETLTPRQRQQLLDLIREGERSLNRAQLDRCSEGAGILLSEVVSTPAQSVEPAQTPAVEPAATSGSSLRAAPAPDVAPANFNEVVQAYLAELRRTGEVRAKSLGV